MKAIKVIQCTTTITVTTTTMKQYNFDSESKRKLPCHKVDSIGLEMPDLGEEEPM